MSFRKSLLHFTEIHRGFLEKVEYILNRPITNFYNSDDVNATANFGKLKRDQSFCKW